MNSLLMSPTLIAYAVFTVACLLAFLWIARQVDTANKKVQAEIKQLL